MFKNHKRKIVTNSSLIETIIDEDEESDHNPNHEEEVERDLSIVLSQAGEEENKDDQIIYKERVDS